MIQTAVWATWAEFKESFFWNHTKKLTSINALEKARQLLQGPSETVTTYNCWFRNPFPYLRTEIATLSFIEAMIKGL